MADRQATDIDISAPVTTASQTLTRDRCLSNAPGVGAGRDSSVGIATRYGLDGSAIESRWGERFSAPVQTGPGVHPASYTMGTGSLPGVKRPGCGVDHPPLPRAEVNERVIPLLPLWVFVVCSGVKFKFTFTRLSTVMRQPFHTGYYLGSQIKETTSNF